MKHLALTILLCSVISSSALGDEEKIPKKPNNWQPIYGLNVEGQKAYVDANSLTTHSVDSGEQYNYGEVLISSEEILDITVGQKKLKVRSMVKQMVIECKSGLMAPVYDLYFDVSMPTRIDKPIAGTEYMDVKIDSRTLPKDSILYKTLCPIYI
jgi:hypothetical protein